MAGATKPSTRKRAPMTAGLRFERLVSIRFERRADDARRRPLWRFLCDCGNEVVSAPDNVKTGNTRSCGCLQREVSSRTGKLSLKHGMSRTGVYGIWGGMIDRCTNTVSKDYPNYGGRGITVCDRWRDPENFISDMGPRPPKAQIERVDNNGPYSPDNCIWASPKTQARNRRSTHFVRYNGQRMSLIEACDLAGTSYSAVKERLRMGWEEHRAISTPLRADSRRNAKVPEPQNSY